MNDSDISFIEKLDNSVRIVKLNRALSAENVLLKARVEMLEKKLDSERSHNVPSLLRRQAE